MSNAIIYLHGFCSSPESWKAKHLAEIFSGSAKTDCFHCPFLSHVPDEAIRQAEEIIIGQKKSITLAGSSLGGFYATWLAEKYDLRAVLINPAVLASLSMASYLGEQSNLYTHEKFVLTVEHIEQLRRLEIEKIMPERYFLMVETGDEVLDYRQAVKHYAGCQQIVIEGGNHSFTSFHALIPQLLEFAEI